MELDALVDRLLGDEVDDFVAFLGRGEERREEGEAAGLQRATEDRVWGRRGGSSSWGPVHPAPAPI